MDEEDGRPGPGARQPGPIDVLMDASTGSCAARILSREIKELPFHPVRCEAKDPTWEGRRQLAPPQVASQSLQSRGETP